MILSDAILIKTNFIIGYASTSGGGTQFYLKCELEVMCMLVIPRGYVYEKVNAVCMNNMN